jgi:hypothetical protein
MEIVAAILNGGSRCRDGASAVVEVLGGNVGHEAALAAVHGCSVLTFEPVTRYIDTFRCACSRAFAASLLLSS